MNERIVHRIRVLIADDHAVLRETLRLMLDAQADIEVVGDVSDGRQAVDAAERLRPDLILMDAEMPGLSGIEATRQLHRRAAQALVLILTAHGEDEEIINALAAGAAGVMLKTFPSVALLQAIRTVIREGSYLPPEILQRERVVEYLQNPRREAGKQSAEILTRREREILQLLAEGNSSRAIAEELVLSPKTVEAHRDHISTKLGTHNRSELILFAIRHGLVHLKDRPDSPAAQERSD